MHITEQADVRALEAEQAAAAERRRQKEQERIEVATREADQLEQQHGQTNGQGGEVPQSESIEPPAAT